MLSKQFLAGLPKVVLSPGAIQRLLVGLSWYPQARAPGTAEAEMAKIASMPLGNDGWATRNWFLFQREMERMPILHHFADHFQRLDLDLLCLAFDANGECSEEVSGEAGEDANPSVSIIHSGNDQDGGYGGDDEQIFITFSKVPDELQILAIVVVETKGDNINKHAEAVCHIADRRSDKDFVSHKLEIADPGQYHLVAVLYRDGNDWGIQNYQESHAANSPDEIEDLVKKLAAS